MGSDLWFHYFERAINEGMTEEDAAKKAYSDCQDHYAEMWDRQKEINRELAIKDIRRQAK